MSADLTFETVYEHATWRLQTEQLLSLLNQERKKYLLALDYGFSGSDLEEIRDTSNTWKPLFSQNPAGNLPRAGNRSPEFAAKSVFIDLFQTN